MYNNCQFIGRLAATPEIRYSAGGDAIANFTLACTEKYKDKENTEWVRVVAFGKLAEIIEKYLDKGALCFIAGKMQTRQWDDKDGNKRYTTEIIAREMKMLGGKKEGGDVQSGGYGGGSGTGDDDQMPF